MDLPALRDQIATIHRKTTADFTILGVDILTPAINAARRKAESLIDFEYSNTDADLAIAADTWLGNLANATEAGSATPILVKRIQHVFLPIGAAPDFIPIDFLTNETRADRLKQQIGRHNFDPDLEIADYGIGDNAPYCWQQGQVLAFGPASQFGSATLESGFTARLAIVRFLPDYVDETSTALIVTGTLTVSGVVTVGAGDETSSDFIMENGWRFLLWESVLQVNRYWKTFAPKEEGNIDEANIQAYAAEALQELAAWNQGIRAGTTSPNEPRQANG